MNLSDEFKNLPGIYIITNLLNGKKYVGETLNVKRRIAKHCKNNCQLIHSAFNKYGKENFDVYVEYFTNFSKEDLWKLEEELIKKFNCLTPNGYNINPYGVGGKNTEDTKIKISKANKGRKMSVESNLARSNSLKGRPAPNKGKSPSEETREKLRKAMTDAIASGYRVKSTPVNQIDLITGEIINTYSGIAEAARQMGVSPSSIKNCLYGKRKTSKGFKWAYVDK